MEKAWKKMTHAERVKYIQESPKRLTLISKALLPEDYEAAEQLYALGRTIWDVQAVRSEYRTRYLESEAFLLEQSIRKLDWVRCQYQTVIEVPYVSFDDAIQIAGTMQTYELLGEPGQTLEAFIKSYPSPAEILKAGRKELEQISHRKMSLWQASYTLVMGEYEIENQSNPNALYCLGSEEDGVDAILDALGLTVEEVLSQRDESDDGDSNASDPKDDPKPEAKISSLAVDPNLSGEEFQQKLKEELEHHHIIFPDEFWDDWEDDSWDSRK